MGNKGVMTAPPFTQVTILRQLTWLSAPPSNPGLSRSLRRLFSVCKRAWFSSLLKKDSTYTNRNKNESTTHGHQKGTHRGNAAHNRSRTNDHQTIGG